MYPIKKCEFCGKTGPAYTWDVTICPECHKTVSSNIGECWKEISQLRAKLRELVKKIDKISNDYIPDNDTMAPLALDEMRGAIWDALEAAKEG